LRSSLNPKPCSYGLAEHARLKYPPTNAVAVSVLDCQLPELEPVWRISGAERMRPSNAQSRVLIVRSPFGASTCCRRCGTRPRPTLVMSAVDHRGQPVTLWSASALPVESAA